MLVVEFVGYRSGGLDYLHTTRAVGMTTQAEGIILDRQMHSSAIRCRDRLRGELLCHMLLHVVSRPWPREV